MSKSGIVITGIPAFKNKVEELSKKLVHNDDTYNEIGSMIAEQIRNRTRDRRGDYKQKPLTEVTIETRKLLAKANTPSPFYVNKKSNLTFTGQLLNSIKSKINVSTNEVRLYLDDFRMRSIAFADNSKLPKNAKPEVRAARNIASKIQPLKTNNEIRKELEAQGRIFFVIHKDLLKRVEQDITKWINQRKSKLIKSLLK